MLKQILIILLTSYLLLCWYFLYIYNNVIKKKNLIEQSFSSIDILLQKRSDLIPNLVAIAQQYMEFEKGILVEITKLRSSLISSKLSKNSKLHIENQISKQLQNLFIRVEEYPTLKTNDHFINLQYSLNEIEEQISAARRFYSSAVNDYNNALEMFPTSVIASSLNYRKKSVFVANDEDRQNVDINNLFKRK
jgi:LemA protein